jgi:hypothetical protein
MLSLSEQMLTTEIMNTPPHSADTWLSSKVCRQTYRRRLDALLKTLKSSETGKSLARQKTSRKQPIPPSRSILLRIRDAFKSLTSRDK